MTTTYTALAWHHAAKIEIQNFTKILANIDFNSVSSVTKVRYWIVCKDGWRM